MAHSEHVKAAASLAILTLAVSASACGAGKASRSAPTSSAGSATTASPLVGGRWELAAATVGHIRPPRIQGRTRPHMDFKDGAVLGSTGVSPFDIDGVTIKADRLIVSGKAGFGAVGCVPTPRWDDCEVDRAVGDFVRGEGTYALHDDWLEVKAAGQRLAFVRVPLPPPATTT